MAMIVDAGISIGDSIVRPSVSASRIMKAPSSAVKGINILWSCPTSRRAICGTRMPTNEMTPATTTDTADNNTATAAMAMRAPVTWKPMLLAVLSDSTSTLHHAYMANAKTSPIEPYVAIMVTSSHVFNVRSDVMDPDVEAPKLMNASVSPENMALMAIPTKISFSGFSPDFQDRAKTSRHATAPPMNAASGEKKKYVGKKDTTNSFATVSYTHLTLPTMAVV